MKHILPLLMILAGAISVRASETVTPTATGPGIESGSGRDTAFFGAPLCRAVPGDKQTETVPKKTVESTRALCTDLTEAINKCVHLENTVIWLGVWQQAHSAGVTLYTNRLDLAELQHRILTLTSEINMHTDQLQTLIRRQNAIGP